MERIITRISLGLALGCTRDEIHAEIVGPDCDEQTFFFCWIAVSML